ncbi:unnamed protein product, partial [Rotaria magnacalcarata]
HQPSTPYHHQQQPQMSTPQAVYPPIYFPIQANMPYLPMTGTYLVPQGGPPQQLQPSFYPTFYSHSGTHQAAGQ